MELKDNILRDIKRIKFIIDLEEMSIQLDKNFKKSCRNFVIINFVSLILLLIVNTYTHKVIDYFDIIVVSIIICSMTHQISSIASSDSSIRNHEVRLEELNEKLKYLKEKLEELEE